MSDHQDTTGHDWTRSLLGVDEMTGGRHLRSLHGARQYKIEEGAHENMKRWYGFAIVLAGLAASGAAQEKKEQDLPYKAVHDPQFIAAGSATFLHDPDRVIGVMAGTVAKAYPAAILSQHGLVEDESPSGPIAITW